MKKLVLCLFLFNTEATTFFGKVLSEKSSCQDRYQVYISHEKLQVYQIEVPLNGNFEVVLPEKNYEIAIVGKRGCSAIQKIQLKGKTIYKEFMVKK